MKLLQSPTTKRHFMVVAQYFIKCASTMGKDHMRVMGVYKAVTPRDAFDQFLKQYASDITSAQKFHDKIFVVEIYDNEQIFLMSEQNFGQLAKFPNPELFRDEDMYF